MGWVDGMVHQTDEKPRLVILPTFGTCIDHMVVEG